MTFGGEVRALGERLRAGQGPADELHLAKILTWYYFLFIVGHGTLHWSPNLMTIMCLSTASFVRWTIVAHHVCHGGYDFTQTYSRKTFGVGSLFRRASDWFDWILPESWNVEHGRLHHYSLNESNDPDLVERNLSGLRRLRAPLFVKYVAVAFLACTWKWFYYASNTYSCLLRGSKDGAGEPKVVTLMSILTGKTPSWWSTSMFFTKVFGPFFVLRFCLLPACIQYLCGAGRNALMNILFAELLTNIHSFCMITTNHCGEDLTRFDTHVEPKSDEFYVRQVLGSADFYTGGGDLIDFLHGFLNYQAEHHMWPDLSVLSYQRAHAEVKEICARHDVHLVEENVFTRLRKTVDIMVGNTSMIRI
jgi:fatty acid desaturase